MRESSLEEYEDARDLFYELCRDWRQLWAAELNGTSLDPAVAKRLADSVPLGVHEHFKSGDDDQKFYGVLGVVGGSSSKHPPVGLYFALYGPRAGNLVQRKLLLRGDGFLWPINRSDRPKGENFVGARFKLIKAMTVDDVWDLRLVAHECAKLKNRADCLHFINTLG